MPGNDRGNPTGVLNDLPEEFEHGRLVGVNSSGVPIYFEPSDQRAYEVIRSGGELEAREPRWKGPLASVIENIEDAIGWDELSPFGEENKD